MRQTLDEGHSTAVGLTLDGVPPVVNSPAMSDAPVRARITVASNPRALIPIALVPGGIAVGVALTALVHPVIGIIALVVVASLGYTMIRGVVNHLRSYLEAGPTGLVVSELGEGAQVYGWPEVSRAGLADTDEGETLYVYVESTDQLITIGREFANFDSLREEIARHVPPSDLQLSPGENLTERLREGRQ